jgi:cell division protein FtsZ
MNITGGANLSLYEVNEAADIVATASDAEVNMIFGAGIDDKLTDEIMVTVIATGFEHKPSPSQAQQRRSTGSPSESVDKSSGVRPFGSQPTGDQLDIPTFLRNRGKNNPTGR